MENGLDPGEYEDAQSAVNKSLRTSWIRCYNLQVSLDNHKFDSHG